MLTSAIHYPHSRITDKDTMRRALLYWDHYNVIGPWPDFDPEHEGEIAEAWKTNGFGKVIAPNETEQEIAHHDIVEFLKSIPPNADKFLFNPPRDGSAPEVYEVYPSKLLGKTWWELEQAGWAGDILPNADRPMGRWGGLAVMAKLADACGGEAFARVTDRPEAYRAMAKDLSRLGNGAEPWSVNEAMIAPVLLAAIDATSIDLSTLIRFRQDERDPTFRHSLLSTVSDHVEALRRARTERQFAEIQDQFEKKMKLDLEKLRDALRSNKVRFALSTSLFVALSGGLAALAAVTHGPLLFGTALAAAGGAGFGGKEAIELFSSGFDLHSRQRDIMSKHPMAYMQQLSQHAF